MQACRAGLSNAIRETTRKLGFQRILLCSARTEAILLQTLRSVSRDFAVATFLICHGAWAAGWAWKKMRPLLRAAGHDVFTPTYTGLGERVEQAAPHVDLETHIRDILSVLHYEDLRDVILIGHSYGGMVATGVADRASSRIAQLIYVDAFVPHTDECLYDLLPEQMKAQRQSAAEAAGDGWLVPPSPIPPDTSADDVAWLIERRRHQPVRTFTQRIALEHEAPLVDRAYIYCKRTMPDDRFGKFAKRAKLEGWRYFEIDASHSPNVTAPQDLAALFQEALRVGIQ